MRYIAIAKSLMHWKYLDNLSGEDIRQYYIKRWYEERDPSGKEVMELVHNILIEIGGLKDPDRITKDHRGNPLEELTGGQTHDF